MTSFVQRLVARNSTKVNLPGMAVLQIRPMARFEPKSTLSEVNVETTAPRDRAASENSNPFARSDDLFRPATQGSPFPSERHSDNIMSESTIPVASDRVQNAFTPEPRDREFAPQRIAEIKPMQSLEEKGAKVTRSALPVRDERADPITMEDRKAALPVQTTSPLPPVNILSLAERDSEKQVTRNPKAPTLMPPVPKAPQERSAEKEQTTPSISIGKIEVQFLPANIPAPISRPVPVGNRGFDSYARARRGQPR